jgi:hypothetical protein
MKKPYIIERANLSATLGIKKIRSEGGKKPPNAIIIKITARNIYIKGPHRYAPKKPPFVMKEGKSRCMQ